MKRLGNASIYLFSLLSFEYYLFLSVFKYY